jgi:Ferritin-like domain
MHALTRGGLFKLGAAAAVGAAVPPPDLDLAWARVLVATELLADDFYTQALAAGGPAAMHEARANEREHYAGLAALMNGDGAPPAQAGDIDFSYPKGTFSSAASVRKVGVALESLQLGAYLGAADAIVSEPLRGIVCRIAANEAQHLTMFEPFRSSFPPAFTIEQASTALGAYTS